jgi:hypothetical protein
MRAQPIAIDPISERFEVSKMTPISFGRGQREPQIVTNWNADDRRLPKIAPK